MQKSNSFDQAVNLLCVKLEAEGEVLTATPALRALKQGRPDRRITLLTSREGSEIAGMVPEIDQVILYNAPWLKTGVAGCNISPEYGIINQLRAGRYDAAVIFNSAAQNPLPAIFLSYLADIPLRLAYCQENPFRLLTHWVPDRETGQVVRHEVQRHLALVAQAGCVTSNEYLSLAVPDRFHSRVAGIINGLPLDTRQPWAVLELSGLNQARHFNAADVALTVRALVEQAGCQVVLSGPAASREAAHQVQQLAGVATHNLTAALNLPETAALYAAAPLVITAVTIRAQLAAAVGTPVVTLPELPRPQTVPWGVQGRVLSPEISCRYCQRGTCPPDYHASVKPLTPAALVEAACELLEESFVLQPALV